MWADLGASPPASCIRAMLRQHPRQDDLRAYIRVGLAACSRIAQQEIYRRLSRNDDNRMTSIDKFQPLDLNRGSFSCRTAWIPLVLLDHGLTQGSR
jgi:hypothetical protein